jgi:pantoate--beta-alanine ligase
MPIDVIGCPIHREQDGLAMSSRNTRLTKQQRKVAPLLYETLKSAKIKFGTKNAKQVSEWVDNQFKSESLLELEYFIIADASTLKPINYKSTTRTYRAFIAAYAGDVRLIDNIALN